MNVCLTSLLYLTALSCISLADSIEFRTFTVKHYEAQDNQEKAAQELTEKIDLYKKYLEQDLLGTDSAIAVKIVDNKIHYDDSKQSKFATETTKTGEIVKTDTRLLGTRITGTTTYSGDHVQVQYTYQSAHKAQDLIVMDAALMPEFQSYKKNSGWTFTLNGEGKDQSKPGDWIVQPIVSKVTSDEAYVSFIAIRYIVD